MDLELKFRAWHKDNNCFIYKTLKQIWMNGWGCCEAMVSTTLPKDKSGNFTTIEALEKLEAFEPNADWKQYINRQDKNGTDIYVGAMVECFYSENLRDEGLFTGIVVWDNERTRFKIVEIQPYKYGEEDGEIIYFDEAEDIEVINNDYPVEKAE